MSDELNVKISEIKAKFIRKEAGLVDKYFGNNDGSLNKAEANKLSTILSGDISDNKRKQKKLAKESDEVKAIFGGEFTSSAKVAATEAQAQAAPAQQTPAASYAAQTQAAAQQADAAKAAEGEKKEAAAPEAKKSSETKAEPKPETKTPEEEVYEAFSKARGYDEKTGKYSKTLKDAYKAVKEEFSDKKKYTKQEREMYSRYIKQLKYDTKHELADAAADRARRKTLAEDDQHRIVNPEALKYRSVSEVRDAEIEALTTADGKVDTRAKRALRQKNTSALKRVGHWISGKYSEGKADDIMVAYSNKSADIRENGRFTKEELEAKFGAGLVQSLIDTGLVKPDANEKGKYSVKGLSLLVANSFGADATNNEHNVPVESETQSIRTKLADYFYEITKANLEKENGGKPVTRAQIEAKVYPTALMSDEKINDLRDFLGYYDDTAHNKLVRTYHSAANRGVGHAATGAAVGLANSRLTRLNIDIDFKSDAVAKSALETMSAVKEVSAKDGGKGVVNLLIEKQRFWKPIGIGAAIGALAGVGLGVIEGLNSKGQEVSCFGIDRSCENDLTYDKLLYKIDNAYSDEVVSPEAKAALKDLALLGFVTEFVKDENGVVYERIKTEKVNGECVPVWDPCKFWTEYDNLRGNGIFNEAELRAAVLKLSNRANNIHNIKVEDCPPDTDPVTETKYGGDPAKTQDPVKSQKQVSEPLFWDAKIDKEDNINVHGHSWKSLQGLYECFDGLDQNKVTRMLKIMQGMQDTKLTVEQITELANISMQKVKVHYLRNSNGKVVYDNLGKPKYDVEDAKKQLEAAFADYQFPAGYKFNYEQCAKSLCGGAPGDNGDMLIAPKELTYSDPKVTPCKRRDNLRKAARANDLRTPGDRGSADKVGTQRRATQQGDKAVNFAPSDDEFSNAQQKGTRKTLIQ